MKYEVKVGDRIKDNDPRTSGRVLIVEEVVPGHPHSYANCVDAHNPQRKPRIRLDRIYTDGKPRRTGFTLLMEDSR